MVKKIITCDICHSDKDTRENYLLQTIEVSHQEDGLEKEITQQSIDICKCCINKILNGVTLYTFPDYEGKSIYKLLDTRESFSRYLKKIKGN